MLILSTKDKDFKRKHAFCVALSLYAQLASASNRTSKSNEHFFRQSIVRQSVPFVASFCQVSEQEVEANFSLVGGSTKNWASLGLIPSLPLAFKGRMQQWALWGGAVRKYQYASLSLI